MSISSIWAKNPSSSPPTSFHTLLFTTMQAPLAQKHCAGVSYCPISSSTVESTLPLQKGKPKMSMNPPHAPAYSKVSYFLPDRLSFLPERFLSHLSISPSLPELSLRPPDMCALNSPVRSSFPVASMHSCWCLPSESIFGWQIPACGWESMKLMRGSSQLSGTRMSEFRRMKYSASTCLRARLYPPVKP